MDIRTYALSHGGFPRVADHLGLNAEFLRQVAKGRRRFSPEMAIEVEAKLNGAVSRSELRPDIWPKGEDAA
jgi:DNA-binding transcriptional regulator YdaS (Cro superfamily)